jgi:hypothetical protein
VETRNAIGTAMTADTKDLPRGDWFEAGFYFPGAKLSHSPQVDGLAGQAEPLGGHPDASWTNEPSAKWRLLNLWPNTPGRNRCMIFGS